MFLPCHGETTNFLAILTKFGDCILFVAVRGTGTCCDGPDAYGAPGTGTPDGTCLGTWILDDAYLAFFAGLQAEGKMLLQLSKNLTLEVNRTLCQ